MRALTFHRLSLGRLAACLFLVLAVTGCGDRGPRDDATRRTAPSQRASPDKRYFDARVWRSAGHRVARPKGPGHRFWFVRQPIVAVLGPVSASRGDFDVYFRLNRRVSDRQGTMRMLLGGADQNNAVVNGRDYVGYAHPACYQGEWIHTLWGRGLVKSGDRVRFTVIITDHGHRQTLSRLVPFVAPPPELEDFEGQYFRRLGCLVR